MPIPTTEPGILLVKCCLLLHDLMSKCSFQLSDLAIAITSQLQPGVRSAVLMMLFLKAFEETAACLTSLYIWRDFVEKEMLHQTHLMQVILVNSMQLSRHGCLCQPLP